MELFYFINDKLLPCEDGEFKYQAALKGFRSKL